MQKPQSALRSGDVVRVRGGVWRIRALDPSGGCDALHLIGVDPQNHGAARTLLWPFDRPVHLCRTRRPRVVRPRRWARAFRAACCTSAPWDGLTAAPMARVALLSYQLEPALALIGGAASRVLLADEVGLGKTIQSGLALAELRVRDAGSRALILTPSSLREQWASELTGRFGIAADIVDPAALRRISAELPVGVNPWTVPAVVIASIDFIKRTEVLRAVASLTWDLLIVDEAHFVSGTTDRRQAAEAIARQARRVLLLTATPHAGSDPDFHTLCAVGRLNDGPVAFFRRRRAEVGLAHARRIRVVRVPLTPTEARMHGLLDAYTREVWDHAPTRSLADARLAMIVLRKRALSSAGSLARSLSRRLHWLDSPSENAPHQLPLPLSTFAEEESDGRDAGPSRELGAVGLTDARREREWLRALRKSARLASRDESKISRLLRMLERTREPVIVFTEYRDTLLAIRRALGDRWPVAMLHGGLKRMERSDAITSFTRGAARVLLATDAGGEGLNLQARCRWVINYELPWNPLRLEQRIGRVDRIGQRRRVHVAHLLASGTAESDLLVRLAARLERVRSAIGAVDDLLGSSEHTVAEAIVTGSGASTLLTATDSFGTAPEARPHQPAADPAGRDLREPHLLHLALAERARQELSRLMDIRRMAGVSEQSVDGSSLENIEPGPDATAAQLPDWIVRTAAALEQRGPWIGRIRRRGRQRRSCSTAIFLYRCDVEEESGRAVETLLIPVASPFSMPQRHSPRDTQKLFETLLTELGASVRAEAKRYAVARLTDLAPRHRAARARALLRESAIAELAAEEAMKLQQPLLFGRAAGQMGTQTGDHTDSRPRAEANDRAAGLIARDVELVMCGWT